MRTRLSRIYRRPWRGLGALALLAAAPKCFVCVAGWLGLGALLGLGAPEMCGLPSGPAHPETTILSVVGVLVLLGGAGFWFGRRRKPRSPAGVKLVADV